MLGRHRDAMPAIGEPLDVNAMPAARYFGKVHDRMMRTLS
jgi:hypothetical protein